MICRRCNSEIQKDDLFCSKCGAHLPIQENGNEVIEKSSKTLFRIGKNKKTIYLFSSIALLMSVVVLLSIFLQNPVRSFKQDIKNNNYSDAIEIYDQKIKGNNEKENQIKPILKDEIFNIKKLFIDEDIDFRNAKERIEKIKTFGLIPQDVKTIITEIESLNNSRISYKKAVEFEKGKNYIDSIKEYKKVIREDEDYELAQKQIEKIVENYKVDVLKQAQDSANSQDYDKSVSLLKEASSIVPDDIDITAMLTVYEKKLVEKNETDRKHKIENAKAEQLIIVENAKIMVQDANYKTLYPDMLQAIITNKSDKTIKNMKVGFLGFDNNGYPVKIIANFDFSGGNYEFVGDADDVNIIKGGRFGENVGWELSETHGISKVLALVKSTSFYDGSTWENPYYPYWIEEYKEKPLH
ncbi:DUF5780 domain-containing protein [Bacillus sp. AK128]